MRSILWLLALAAGVALVIWLAAPGSSTHGNAERNPGSARSRASGPPQVPAARARQPELPEPAVGWRAHEPLSRAPAGVREPGSARSADPYPELTGDDELQWAEDALHASRRLGESLAVEADLPAAPDERRRAATRGRPSVPVACRNRGGGCISHGECCAGLVCAGAVAGYGVTGRCEVAGSLAR